MNNKTSTKISEDNRNFLHTLAINRIKINKEKKELGYDDALSLIRKMCTADNNLYMKFVNWENKNV